MAQFASSTFTGTSGTDIDAIGDGWVHHAAASPSGARIRTLGERGYAAVAAGNACYRNSNAPPSADYASSVSIYLLSNGDSSAGVIARMDATAATFYLAHHDNAAGWRLLRCVSGSFSVLGTPYSQTLTAGQEYRLRLEVEGDQLRLYVDDVLRVSATDSTITAAGYAGVQLNGQSFNGSSDYQLDNFSGDTLAAGAVLALTSVEQPDSAVATFDLPAVLSITATETSDAAVAVVVVPSADEALFADYFAAQWSRPSAVVHKGALYVSWTDSNGATGITRHVHGGATESFVLGVGDGLINGHNSGVIAFLPDDRLLVMWAQHNDQMYYRISTNPLDISAWGIVQVLPTTFPVSYSNLQYLSITGKWYAHYRTGVGGGPGDRPCRVRATSDGVTWDAERIWINEPDERPYVMSWGNGVDRIDFVCTSKHVADSGPADFGIYHCYMVVDAGGVERFYRSDGTFIGTGNVRPTTQMTQIYDGSVVQGWPWDITTDNHGMPCVLWAKHISDYDNRHMHSRWNGVEWVESQIGEPQSRLYYTESWSDGALCFDHYNAHVIYRSVQGPLLTGDPQWSASAWEMEQWETRDQGLSWSATKAFTSGNAAGYKNCKPVSPKGHDGRDAVVWSAGTIGNWDSFDLDCKAGSSKRVAISLTDRTGASVANTEGLSFTTLNASVVGDATVVLASGSSGRIDATGTAYLPAPGAATSAVFVVLSDSDGDPVSDHNAFAGPATVI